jgi:hypothetical protein
MNDEYDEWDVGMNERGGRASDGRAFLAFVDLT